MKRLYKEQKATILTDKESDMFEINKKTNQGDPFFSLLFNTVLQMKATVHAGKRKKEWAYTWETTS